MQVTFVAPVQKDERVKYIPLEQDSNPTISKGNNHIGSIEINPLVDCKQQCYLGLSLNSSGNVLYNRFKHKICFSNALNHFFFNFQLEVNG